MSRHVLYVLTALENISKIVVSCCFQHNLFQVKLLFTSFKIRPTESYVQYTSFDHQLCKASTKRIACTRFLLNTSPRSQTLKLETENAYRGCLPMSLRTFYIRFSKKTSGSLSYLVESWEQLWAWHRSTSSQNKSWPVALMHNVIIMMHKSGGIGICSTVQ